MIDDLDWGRTSDDYARHRAGFPPSFFDRLFADGLVSAGDTLLDLGTGTGTLARGFAARGCLVTATDVSAEQLIAAGKLADTEGLQIEFAECSAEAASASDGQFDVVTAGQCWHWFDRPRAATEVMRVLKSSGRLIVAHFDWLPLPGNVVAATEALIEEHNPAWTAGGGDGRHPRWRADIAAAGFGDIHVFEYEIEVPYSHETWRGRIRASAGVGGTLKGDAVAHFDAAHERLLATQFSEQPLAVPHRVWALAAKKP